MSSDYALLFAESKVAAKQAWRQAAEEMSALGATYNGWATCLSFDQALSYWTLTTRSEYAPSAFQVDMLLETWGGVALDIGSKFGPFKLLVWAGRAEGKTGIGLFESSYAVLFQVNDADVKSVFDHMGTQIANRLGVDFFCLLGDPGINEVSESQVFAALSEAPSPLAEPLFLVVNVRNAKGGRIAGHVNEGWEAVHGIDFVQYLSPTLAAFRD